MGMAKVDGGADTSYADQFMPNRTTPVIFIRIIDEAIGKVTWITTGEKAARKKLQLLGVKPIDCFNLLLNWYLFTERIRITDKSRMRNSSIGFAFDD